MRDNIFLISTTEYDYSKNKTLLINNGVGPLLELNHEPMNKILQDLQLINQRRQ